VDLRGRGHGDGDEVLAGAAEVGGPGRTAGEEVLADDPEPTAGKVPGTLLTSCSSSTEGRSQAASTAGSAMASMTVRAPAKKSSRTLVASLIPPAWPGGCPAVNRYPSAGGLRGDSVGGCSFIEHGVPGRGPSPAHFFAI